MVSAYEEAKKRTRSIRNDLEALIEEVSKLSDSRAQRAAQRAIDGVELVDTELKDAQKRRAAAEEVLAEAQAARSALETSSEAAEEALKALEARVEQAAVAVLASQIPAIEERLRQSLVDIAQDLHALAFLDGKDKTWPPTDDMRRRDSLLGNPMSAIPGWGASSGSHERAGFIEPWVEALGALMSDSSAPLPKV